MSAFLFAALLFSTTAEANCAFVTTEGALSCGVPQVDRVLNADGNQLDNYSCGYANQAGPDHTWDLVCPATGVMEVTLSGLDCDMDLYAVADCDPNAGCRTGSANIGLTDEVIQFVCVAGFTVQVVVEGWAYANGGLDSCDPGEGNYTLTVDAGQPGCAESEDCANGADDDSDGDIDCADADCAADPVCNIPENCTNGIDDNFNGQVDCADSQCFAQAYCCDDDGDGFEDELCGGNDCDDGSFDDSDDDNDGFSDGCDNCPELFNINQIDDDGDGAGNICDTCPDGSDAVDSDQDGTPDGCDLCQGFSDTADQDGDTSPDGCDLCPGGDDRVDSDGDTTPDFCDLCNGGDDRVDANGNGTPDLCDQGSPSDNPSPSTGDDDAVVPEDEGQKGFAKLIPDFCGCQTTGGPSGWMGLWMLAAVMVARRRRP